MSFTLYRIEHSEINTTHCGIIGQGPYTTSLKSDYEVLVDMMDEHNSSRFHPSLRDDIIDYSRLDYEDQRNFYPL